MELNDVQKEAVAEWVSDGLNLSDIQKKISSEFDISMTYIDVRVLVLDLGVDVKDKPEPVSDKKKDDKLEQDGAEVGASGLSVEVDALTRPGSLVSGTVVFTDGVKASWFLDQEGRLALDAGQPGYKPDETDLQLFQEELRAALKKKGM